jgi:hypothetical protein
MKGSRIALAVAAAAAIALPGGTALAATTHTGHAARTARAAKTATVKSRGSRTETVIDTCLNKGQTRPGFYMLACGDGSEYLSRLRWSSWNASEATATGRFSLNTCTPNCAEGKYITSDVLVVLWDARPVPHHAGQRAFMRMTVIYTGKRPAHTSPAFTQSLWYPSAR